MKEISQKQLMMHSLAVACRTHYGIIPYLPARCMRMRTLRGSRGELLRGRMPSCVDLIGSMDQNTEKTDGLLRLKDTTRQSDNQWWGLWSEDGCSLSFWSRVHSCLSYLRMRDMRLPDGMG
jgi:hypothetical protein